GTTKGAADVAAEKSKTMQAAVVMLLESLGYDVNDQHFKRTPERVAKALTEFAAIDKEVEYAEAAALLGVVFDDVHDSRVIVGQTRAQCSCAHQMGPCSAHAWFDYIADEKVVGVSKPSFLLHYYARWFTL